MSVVLNSASFLKNARSFLPEKKKEFTERMEKICFFIEERALAMTPVHTGETVANYQWSIDVPFSGNIDPVQSPLDPGHTNTLPLGSEPRRRANEAMSRISLHDIDFSAAFGKTIWLVNNADQWGGLEMGMLPMAPLKQRSPMGMLGVTLAEVEARMQSKAL